MDSVKEITMEKTKLNWKEEDNNYLNNVFNIANICYAMAIILAPLITLVFCLIGIEMDVLNVYLILCFLYILTRVIYYSINFRFVKFRKLDLFEIIGLALIAMFLISSIINVGFLLNKGSHLATFVIVLNFFFAFLAFGRIDKKYYKLLLYTFIFTITVCSIMGMCDLSNSYMPGFSENTFPMSLQFMNSNYSAYITVMAIMLCILVLHKFQKLWEQIVFWLCFVILNVALFINGCFSAETAMFVGELFLLIYLWIKNKKCPWIMLVCLCLSIGTSYIWIKGVSTSGANYMYEALAVIDGRLHTNLVRDVSTFFDKIFHTGIIDGVAGSDGWDRNALTLAALRAITSSAKMFLFGGGAGYNYDIRVHNVYLQIWLEYGLICLALYLTLLIILIVRLFKTKFSTHNVFMFAVMIAVIAVCHYFGCLDPYSFSYYVCLFAICAKRVNGKYLEKRSLLKSQSKETMQGEDENLMDMGDENNGKSER